AALFRIQAPRLYHKPWGDGSVYNHRSGNEEMRFRVLALLAWSCLSAAGAGPTVKLIRFGGNDQDSLAGFAIDRQGNYYIAGTTASANLPANGFQSRPGGANLSRFRGPHMRSLYPPGASAISAIAADPSHRGYLYAAFSGAVWKSTDGGDTWKRLE